MGLYKPFISDFAVLLAAGGDCMATSTFDRPLVLTEQGVDNLIALMKKWTKDPPKPDNIKPYSDAERAEVDELLQLFFHSDD